MRTWEGVMDSQKTDFSKLHEEFGDEVNLGIVFLVAIVLLVALSIVIYFGGAWVLPPTTPAPHV